MTNEATLNSTINVPRLRWQIPLVLLITVVINYFDRMSISYALPKIASDYGWTVKEIENYGGLLMSIFYIGGIIMFILGWITKY